MKEPKEDPKGGDDPSTPRWLAGYFLISEVELTDPSFQQTVILLITHDEKGALGLVINRKLEVTLGQVVTEFEDTDAGKLSIYQGGPVQPQYLFTIHSGLPDILRSKQASSPLEQVVFEPVFPVLTEFLKGDWQELPEDARPPINLYSGYAGWSPGQLETEMLRGAWIVRPAAVKHIFSANPQEEWRQALGELGGMHKIIAETGFKPSMN
ncbi:MAG: transcriptional regulator [Spirochaetales bacterium]|nr:transcriptional regulator [Spirochaetales bacterium]